MINRAVNSALPLQQVSYKTKFETEKDKYNITKWMKDSMDALESIGRGTLYHNIDIRKNYEIMQGRFNIEDYIDAFDAYDMSSIIYEEMKLPSFMKHYDITTKAVKLLLGEYIKRPDIHQVIAEDLDSVNEKVDVKSDLLHQYIQQEITQELTPKLLAQGIDPNKSDFKTQDEADKYKQMVQQKYQELTPESIDKYMTYDYRTAAESWGQSVLLNDKKRFNMNELDQLEFYHMLVADRCFSHLYLTADGYNMEVWNPLHVFYQNSPDLRYIEDAGWVGRTLFLTKVQIIDIFGWRMTLDQIESLYPDTQREGNRGNVYAEFFNATLLPFTDAREYSNISEALGQGLSTTGYEDNNHFPSIFSDSYSAYGGNYMFAQSDLVQVTQGYWKSQRKVGKLNIVNPDTQQVDTMMVDETFDPKLFGVEVVKETYRDTNDPNTISWTWQTQVWQGVKVNVNYQRDQDPENRSAIYIDIRPCPFQFKGDNPKVQFKCKLPVVGQVFNNINGKSQSMVDLLKPYQILVNAFYNQGYQIAQKNNGKFFLMGASLLQANKDWGGEEAQEKFMTVATNMGLMVIDDTPGKINPNTMQYGVKVIDMDESDRITKSINLAMLIEQQGFLQLGITPQRQGTVTQSAAVGTTQTAVNNSYAITEIYFEQYSNYRRRKLQMMLDIAQFCALRNDDVTIPYVTSDLGQSFVKVSANDLLLRDLGVYINNTAEMQRKKETIEQLILKNNQNLLPLSQLINVVRQDNLADIQKSIEQAEQAQQKNAQAQQQSEQQAQQAEIQAKAQEADKQRQFLAQQNQLDRENKIEVASINSIGYDADVNNSPDGKLDAVGVAKLDLEKSKHDADVMLKSKELNHSIQQSNRDHELEKTKVAQKDKELGIKKQELESKKILENKKLATEKQKMVNDKAIEKLKIKAKPKVTRK